MRSLLVTAFGPFGAFEQNPSEVIAHRLFGEAAVVIPVSYKAVDQFVENFSSDAKAVLMLGVGAPCDRLRVERIARNRVGTSRDVDGVVLGKTKIDPNGPETINGSLFGNWKYATRAWKPNRDAGDYLCNYLYYRMAAKWPSVKSGFVHVPPLSNLSLDVQCDYLMRVIKRIQKENP
ncbi:MAG: hypothetical protein KIT74_03795 [Fimbriimonadales bacterium]|nr:hypothetical protein [Fimbriimonadales bacterium]